MHQKNKTILDFRSWFDMLRDVVMALLSLPFLLMHFGTSKYKTKNQWQGLSKTMYLADAK